MRSAVAAFVMLPLAAMAQPSASQPQVPPPTTPISGNAVADPNTIPLAIIAGQRCHGFAMHSPPSPGTTIVIYKIATDGSVKDVALKQSSGTALQDDFAIKCVLGRRYQPAKKDGQRVEVPWTFEITWHAPEYRH